jgi:hypothetical protein
VYYLYLHMPTFPNNMPMPLAAAPPAAGASAFGASGSALILAEYSAIICAQNDVTYDGS